jgi:hypothetical protein
MQTACSTAYQTGQTPGTRSTPMIAIDITSDSALNRSKARRDPPTGPAIPIGVAQQPEPELLGRQPGRELGA